MTYLMIEEDGQLRQEASVTTEDKLQLVDGTLQIAKFDGRNYLWAEVDDEEALTLTWEKV